MSWATREQISEVLEAVEGIEPNSAGFIRVRCPFCPVKIKRNLYFNRESGWFNCYRCGTKAWAWGKPDVLIRDDTPKPPPGWVDLPPGFQPLEQNPLPQQLRPYVHYLLARGVSVDTILDLSIGACCDGEYAGMVIVPVDVRGVQVGWVGRSIVGKRYSTPGLPRERILFNQDVLDDDTTDEPVLVVEGVYDAMPHMPNVVACFGQPTDDHIAILLGTKRPLAIMLDADAQRNSWAIARLLWMRGKDAWPVRIPPGTDPGKLPSGLCQKLMKEARAQWSNPQET